MDIFSRQRLGLAFAAFVILELVGSVGFSRFEGIAYSESFYQTLYLLLTHYDHYGFKSAPSRILVVILLLCSLLIIAYLLKWFAEYIIGFNEKAKIGKMKAKISKLKNHYIVCGLGRVGNQVIRELASEGVEFVALDREQEKVDAAVEAGYLAIIADGTEEGLLEELNVESASGLVTCLGSDRENLFVTLAARAANPSLYIVARASRPESEVKLKRAGADRVAMPYQIGGYHMATMVLRPSVVDYMEVAASNKPEDLQVEEMLVVADSKLAGHRLSHTLGSLPKISVIAIKGADGESHVHPTGREVIYPGDRLIIMGGKKDLTEASALIRG